MATIFFNYYHDGEEKKRAKNIIRGLGKNGHIVITDLGQHWREKIVPRLNDCDGVVVLLTPESLKHDLTVLEWSIAYGVSLIYKHLTLLPVVLNEKVRVPAVLADAGVKINAIKRNDDQIVEEINSKIIELLANRSRKMIFISHAHADEDLAEALVGVITSACELPKESIRCTSVPGYTVPIGSHTAIQLKSEIAQTKFVLGIITPESIESKYVLLELGAGWGLGKRIFPLVARGVKASGIPGPLRELNWVDLAESPSCYQLIEELSSVKLMSDKKHESIVDMAVKKLVACAQPKRKQP
jgi:ribosome-binding factor A